MPTETFDFYTAQQIAALLAVNPVTVRRWRTKNKKLGLIKHGPPYEFHGPNVVYPKSKFNQWCNQVELVNGVPHLNRPIKANVPLPATTPAEVANAA